MADTTPIVVKKPKSRGFFRTVFNVDVRRWFAVDEVAAGGRAVASAYRDLFTKTSIKRQETFEEAVQRLQLSEVVLKKQKRNFLFFSFFYLLVGMGLTWYAFYLLLNKGFALAFFVCFIMGILMLSYAYKEHFWYMQISRRKLGCTFKEWINFICKRA